MKLNFKNILFLFSVFVFTFGFTAFIYPIGKAEAATPVITSASLESYDIELGIFEIHVTGTDFFDFLSSEATGEASGDDLAAIDFNGDNPNSATIVSPTEINLVFETDYPITDTADRTISFSAGLVVDESEGRGNTETNLSGETFIDNADPLADNLFSTEGFYDMFLFWMNTNYGLQINFTENLSENSKEAIEEALTEAASGPVTFRWNPQDDGYRRLRVTSSEVTVFADDVSVLISDLVGNSATVKLIDSAEGTGLSATTLSDGTTDYSLPLCSFGEEDCGERLYGAEITFSGSVLNEEGAPISGVDIIESAIREKASSELLFVWDETYTVLRIYADEPTTFTSDVWAYVFPNTDGPKEPRDEGEDEMFNIERVLLIDKDSAIPARRRSSSGSAPRNIIPILPQIPGGEEGCLPGYNFSPLTGQRCNATDPIIPNPENSQNQNQNQNQNQGNSYAFGQTLVKSGTRGEACRAWQTFLNHKSGANLMVDGICGPLTMKVARTWQTSVGLIADGLLGPASRGKALGQ